MKNKLFLILIIILGLISINITVKADEIELEEMLYGDILIGDNSENEVVFQTEANTNLSVTGKYYISRIKGKLEEDKTTIETLTRNRVDLVALSNTSSSFTTTLTLPEGMEFSEEPTIDNVEFSGNNDIFEVSEVTTEGNKVTIVMSLINDYTKFTDLYEDINKVDDILVITVNNVTVKEPGTYVLLGTINGNLVSEAFFQRGQISIKVLDVDYNWDGIQYPDGKDVVATDDETIQFTLNVPEPQQERIIDINPPTFTIIDASKEDKEATISYLLPSLIAVLIATLIYYLRRRKF